MNAPKFAEKDAVETPNGPGVITYVTPPEKCLHWVEHVDPATGRKTITNDPCPTRYHVVMTGQKGVVYDFTEDQLVSQAVG